MKIYKILQAVFVFAVFSSQLFGQDHLQNIRNKTAGRIANSANGTRVDSTFMISRLGTPIRDLAAAIESRSITPFDLSGTNLIATKDTAVSRSRVLLVPKNYTASTLTFKNQDSALVMVNYTTINITASDTIPVGAEIFMEGKGRFQISSGVTLYIAGRFNASRARRFYGGGVVRFGNGAVEKTYPEWFGASNDSTTTISDSGPAIQLAVNATPNAGVVSLASDGRTLQSPKGYVINTTVRIPSERSITIEGNGATIYSSASDTVFLIQNGSQTTIPSYAISPTRNQPKHLIEGIRFKRIASATGTGTAIALRNSTFQTLRDIEVYDYNNALSFINIDSGWCEFNTAENWRVSGVDTCVIFRRMPGGSGGTSSFASNKLSHFTMTGFTDSDVINAGVGRAIGIWTGGSTSIYRNVWDQVILFPKDSVTCVLINGEADAVSGTINFEYIGSTEQSTMRGFHFGAAATELKFNLFACITGRRYFSGSNLVYSEATDSFGHTGIKFFTAGSNQNHGPTIWADSSKFTPLFSVGNAARTGMVSPGDTAYSIFGNLNNSGRNKIDIRGRRHRVIELRSMADGVYSSATANTLRGSALPLQPVGLLDVGGSRTVNDSTTIDVRNSTHMIVADNNSTVDSLTAFKGGIAGQTLTVTFSSSKTRLANLIGGTGSGRLFLLENDHIISQSGMKSYFKCETETGGVFWREMWRSAEYGKTTDYTSTVDSIDVSQVNYIRFNRSVLGNIRNFYNGIDGQMITTLDRTGKSTYLHLGKGTTKGISLIGAASRRDSSGTRHIFVYDGQEDLWREISLSSNTNTAGGGWTDTGTVVNLETTTDNLVIGDSNTGAKVIIDGDADETQLFIKGHSTQTNPYINVHTNASATAWAISTPSGSLHRQTMPNGGTLEITAATITPPTNLDKGIVIGNNTTATISGQPANTFTLYGTGGEAVVHDAQGTVSKLTHAWGSLYMSNATNVISTSGTAGTWVKVTGFTLESSPAGQGITAVADSFTVTVAGTYEINVSMSFHGGTASVDNYKIAMAKNAVANTNYQAAVTTADNSSIVNVHFTGYYSGASVGDDFSLLMTNNTDGDDPTIKQCMITIKRIN